MNSFRFVLVAALGVVAGVAEVRFSWGYFTVMEQAPIIQIERTELVGTAQIELRFVGAGAVEGIDFHGGPFLVEFAAGETNKNVTLPIIDDGLVEHSEVLSCYLTNAIGTTLGLRRVAQVDIRDNEVPVLFDQKFHQSSFQHRVMALNFDRTGRILVGLEGKGLVRLYNDGRPDSTLVFLSGTNRLWWVSPAQMLELPDGKILMGGQFRNGSLDYMTKPAMRVLADGSMDESYRILPDPSTTYQKDYFVAFQSTGRTLIYDWYGRELFALDANGQRDSGFVSNVVESKPVIAILPDDRFLLSYGANVNGSWEFRLQRHLANGAVDESFPRRVVDGLYAMVPTGGGTIWGVTSMNPPNEAAIIKLLKMNEDGEVLMAVEGLRGQVDKLVPLPDGRLLVKGMLAFEGKGLNNLLLDSQGKYDPSLVYDHHGWLPAALPHGEGGVVIGVDGEVKRLLVDNARLSRVEMDWPEELHQEGRTGTIGFHRIGDVSNEATVAVSADGKDATPGVDFNFETWRVTFPALGLNQSVTIELLSDSLTEQDEVVQIGLHDAVGTSLGETNKCQVRIVDLNARPGNFDPMRVGAWDQPRKGIDRMVVTPAGRVIASGFFGSDGEYKLLMGFQQSGEIDETFAPPGLRMDVVPLALQTDGKLIIGGALRNTWLVTRLHENGALDSSFFCNEIRGHSSDRIAIQPDGKVLATGLMNHQLAMFGLFRFLTDGKLDRGFTPEEQVLPFTDIILQPNGRIVVGFSRFVGRLMPDGKMDRSFSPIPYPEGMGGDVRMLQLADGSLLVSMSQQRLLKVDANGLPDEEWEQRVRPNGFVNAMLQMKNGQLVVAGDFTQVGGQERRGLARLETDGRLDESFNPGGGANRPINALLELQNGNLLIGGTFSSFNSMPAEGAIELRTTVPLRLTLVRAGAGWRAQITGGPGGQVSVEASSDLVQWNDLGPVGPEGTLPIPAGTGARFLRARQD